MAISDTLSSIITNLNNAYSQIGTMGGTIPLSKNMENLPSAIGTIPQSGGGGTDRLAEYAMGTLSVINDSNITDVRSYAFMNLSTLTDVNIPNASHIGASAFHSCPNLSNISVSSSITLEQCAFSYCSNLSSFTCSDATNLPSYVFANCTNLSSYNGSNYIDLEYYNSLGTTFSRGAFYDTSLYGLMPSIISFSWAWEPFNLSENKIIIKPDSLDPGHIIIATPQLNGQIDMISSFMTALWQASASNITISYPLASLPKTTLSYSWIDKLTINELASGYNYSSYSLAGTSLVLPAFELATPLSTIGTHLFDRINVSNLVYINNGSDNLLIRPSTFQYSNQYAAFYNNQVCKTIIIDSPAGITFSGNYIFRGNQQLSEITLNSPTVATLSNPTAINSMFTSLPAGYRIYVPASLYADYIAATGWSSVASHIASMPSE